MMNRFISRSASVMTTAVAFALICGVARASEDARVVVREDGGVCVSSAEGVVESVSLPVKVPMESFWRVMTSVGEGLMRHRAWVPVGEGRTIPWYFLATDGTNTCGIGVETGPKAMCAWRIRPNGVELLLDMRSGSCPLEIGDRTFEACRIVRVRSHPGENAFSTGRRLCAAMCRTPRLPKEPLFGFNDWYAAYGRNTATNFLVDAAFVVSLCKGLPYLPTVVMDDGWQKYAPPVVERLTGKFDSGWGPWTESSKSFGMDMKTFCSRIAALGARPGLWYRPLCMNGKTCDPSDPDVIARIKADIGRFRDWGFRFVKMDYLTYDLCGHFSGFDEGGRLVRDRREWKDRGHTTAEIIIGLYQAMRDAAGDDVVLLGCNAVNHLCAGIFEATRVGPDTSGKDWNQTHRNGYSSVAFGGLENGLLYAADPDCVGLAFEGAIPWKKNREWIDLLSRSGMPAFVSWRRQLSNEKVADAFRQLFVRACSRDMSIEPLDWIENPVPCKWRDHESR